MIAKIVDGPTNQEQGASSSERPAIDMAKLHQKNAKITIKLKADSGYSGDITGRVSAYQWGEINRIINELPPVGHPDRQAAQERKNQRMRQVVEAIRENPQWTPEEMALARSRAEASGAAPWTPNLIPGTVQYSVPFDPKKW